MRISDWSSDVCSSDLLGRERCGEESAHLLAEGALLWCKRQVHGLIAPRWRRRTRPARHRHGCSPGAACPEPAAHPPARSIAHNFHTPGEAPRSEEHTSELPSLMRISYAVFCLKKKKTKNKKQVQVTQYKIK